LEKTGNLLQANGREAQFVTNLFAIWFIKLTESKILDIFFIIFIDLKRQTIVAF